MKHFVISLFCVLLAAGTASAQRVQVGLRGGVNLTDHKFAPVTIGNTRFTPGPARVGYETGLILRLNLSKHVHLQTEFDYAFVNYNVHAQGIDRHDVVLKTERLQIPVQLGFQFGILRLYGGVQFRVSDSQSSNFPKLLKIGFNDRDLGIMGGLGLHISKFFLDFRISGYPKSHVWQKFTSDGITERVKTYHDLVYGATLGFFF